MIEDILVNERGAENFQLTGIIYPFAETQEMISAAAEWSSAVNSVIISEHKKYSISTSAFTDVLSAIVKWRDNGFVEFDEVETTDEVAWTKFVRRQSIFVHTSAKRLLNMADVQFDYGVTGFPTIGESLLTYNRTMPSCVNYCDGIPRNGTFTGTVSGLYIGVNRYSTNKAAAVRAVELLSSKEYQREVIPKKEYEKQYLSPTYLELTRDLEFCEPLNGLCEYYRDSIPSVRPSTLSQLLYPNVTGAMNRGLLNIFQGNIDVAKGVDVIDAEIRTLIGIPPYNATEEDAYVRAKPKQKFKNLTTQLLVLLLVFGVTLSMVFMYRRKLVLEKEQKEKSLPPLQQVITTSRANESPEDTARLLQ
jgi:ABC-type glycerol-3-phosphate transport system substrate-binding protein